MLISVNEFAKLYGLARSSVFKRCVAGELKTAHKIGRNWFIDADEQPELHYKKSILAATPNKHSIGPAPPDTYITLKEYARGQPQEYKTLQQKAIRGGFETAIKIGNQWFVHRDEPVKRFKKIKEMQNMKVISLQGTSVDKDYHGGGRAILILKDGEPYKLIYLPVDEPLSSVAAVVTVDTANSEPIEVVIEETDPDDCDNNIESVVIKINQDNRASILEHMEIWRGMASCWEFIMTTKVFPN